MAESSIPFYGIRHSVQRNGGFFRWRGGRSRTIVAALRQHGREDTVKQRSQVRLALLALTAVAAVSAAKAEPYPSGMIRIIVPSAAGTPPSIMARVVANALSESEGWRVIVEDKPGAIAAVGLAEVLKQPADGETIAAIALPTSAAPPLA